MNTLKYYGQLLKVKSLLLASFHQLSSIIQHRVELWWLHSMGNHCLASIMGYVDFSAALFYWLLGNWLVLLTGLAVNLITQHSLGFLIIT